MPRPKKDGISKEVGDIPVTRKRGNPDFKVSSYYIPAALNLKFDRAVLALKAAGFDIDRSDILAALISRFVHQVDVAEQAADAETGLSLEAILDAAGEGSVGETAEVSFLKDQLKTTIANLQASSAATAATAQESVEFYEGAKDYVDRARKLADEAKQAKEEVLREQKANDERFDALAAQMQKQMDLVQKLLDQQG